MKLKRLISGVLIVSMLVISLAACGSTKSVVQINSPADFAGHKIAVQSATTSHDLIQAQLDAGEDIKVSAYEKVTQCFDDLKLDRVDAVYVDSVVAAYYLKDSNEYVRTWISSENEPMGICLDKSSTNLTAAIEAAIDTLYYNGKIAEIAQKNFGEDFSKDLRVVTEKPIIPKINESDLVVPGQLTVGSEVGYPPMEYTTEDGQTYIGFDIDVAAAIAEVLGLKVLHKNTSWDGIFDGLAKKNYDCVISAVSISPERKEKYSLTEPYVANAQCIVTKK